MSGARRRKRGCGTLLVVAMIFSLSVSAQTANKASAREKLLGAWHLIHIDASGPDGKPASVPQPKGMLIYARDGHMSVQLMNRPGERCLQASQRFGCLRVQRNVFQGSFRFRRTFHHCRDRSADVQDETFEIHVLPPKPNQFASAQPSESIQLDDRPKWIFRSQNVWCFLPFRANWIVKKNGGFVEVQCFVGVPDGI